MEQLSDDDDESLWWRLHLECLELEFRTSFPFPVLVISCPWPCFTSRSSLFWWAPRTLSPWSFLGLISEGFFVSFHISLSEFRCITIFLDIFHLNIFFFLERAQSEKGWKNGIQSDTTRLREFSIWWMEILWNIMI